MSSNSVTSDNPKTTVAPYLLTSTISPTVCASASNATPVAAGVFIPDAAIRPSQHSSNIRRLISSNGEGLITPWTNGMAPTPCMQLSTNQNPCNTLLGFTRDVSRGAEGNVDLITPCSYGVERQVPFSQVHAVTLIKVDPIELSTAPTGGKAPMRKRELYLPLKTKDAPAIPILPLLARVRLISARNTSTSPCRQK